MFIKSPYRLLFLWWPLQKTACGQRKWTSCSAVDVQFTWLLLPPPLLLLTPLPLSPYLPPIAPPLLHPPTPAPLSPYLPPIAPPLLHPPTPAPLSPYLPPIAPPLLHPPTPLPLSPALPLPPLLLHLPPIPLRLPPPAPLLLLLHLPLLPPTLLLIFLLILPLVFFRTLDIDSSQPHNPHDDSSKMRKFHSYQASSMNQHSSTRLLPVADNCNVVSHLHTSARQ